MPSDRHACPTGTHDAPHRWCYSSHDCRCAGCTDAWRLYIAERRADTRTPEEVAADALRDDGWVCIPPTVVDRLNKTVLDSIESMTRHARSTR